jgi:hypothetical protein
MRATALTYAVFLLPLSGCGSELRTPEPICSWEKNPGTPPKSAGIMWIFLGGGPPDNLPLTAIIHNTGVPDAVRVCGMTRTYEFQLTDGQITSQNYPDTCIDIETSQLRAHYNCSGAGCGSRQPFRLKRTCPNGSVSYHYPRMVQAWAKRVGEIDSKSNIPGKWSWPNIRKVVPNQTTLTIIQRRRSSKYRICGSSDQKLIIDGKSQALAPSCTVFGGKKFQVQMGSPHGGGTFTVVPN